MALAVHAERIARVLVPSFQALGVNEVELCSRRILADLLGVLVVPQLISRGLQLGGLSAVSKGRRSIFAPSPGEGDWQSVIFGLQERGVSTGELQRPSCKDQNAHK